VQLNIFRSERAEDLAEALAEQLRADARDPFEPVPVVVGSRGMERWLRHQLATHLGIAANIAFPFPRQALDGLAAALLAGTAGRDRPFWQPAADGAMDRWQTDPLTFTVLAALRGRLELPEFAVVRKYLQLDQSDNPATIAFRELAFAREVADVLDKLLHDRHADALQWAANPVAAGAHAWLAQLLAAVGAADPQSPAQVRARLLAQKPEPVTGVAPLRLFCLSTLGPADREMLEALARRVPVELYLLAPSRRWWADIRSRKEQWWALQRAATPQARADLEHELANQNRLLAGLGIPSRDVQVWLETLPYSEPAMPTQEFESASDLHKLQHWIDEAGDTAALRDAGLVADGSLAMHTCWGALRQVEVLRDELLRLFQDHPGAIEPRDVLVMTPDIETFAPLVSAVFARRGPMERAHAPAAPIAPESEDDDTLDARGKPTRNPQLPVIPLSIADLGLVRVNPVAEVLLAVLALADGRVAAPQVYGLLALEPVRLRLDLSADDVADLRDLMDESGMRWALDAGDRAAVQQPALFQNTLDFGLERLALGALMADPEPLELLQVGEDDVVPLPVRNTARVARVAALGRLINALRAVRDRQGATPHGRKLLDWKQEWLTILEDFADTTDAARWLTAQVRCELEAFEQAGAGFAGLLSLDAGRRALRGRFDLSVRGDRAITGAVTVCALQPMRSVPFKIIALLGMDDGTFPAARTRRAWDPLSQSKPGEVDPRLTQRHLLLETLLSARQRLLIFWNGFGRKPLETFAPAVPVVELRELLIEASGLLSERWVTAHPLQPWSPRAFEGRHFPYARAVADAAGVLAQVRAGQLEPQAMGLAATDRARCAPEPNPPNSVSLDELAAGLTQAQAMFLRERLQFSLPKDRAELQDREPIELDALDKWGVRDAVMQVMLDDPNREHEGLVDTLTRRLQAEGQLPLQAGGRRVVLEAHEKVANLIDNFAKIAGEAAPSTDLVRVDVTVQRGGKPWQVRVQGAPLATRTHQGLTLLEWISPSKSNKPKNLLRTWLYLLAARANGQGVAAARVVGDGDAPAGPRGRPPNRVAGAILATAVTPDQALAQLADLVAIWLDCRDRPMPLFVDTSWAYAEMAGKDAGKARSAVRAAWSGDGKSKSFKQGEGSSTVLRALFAGWDPLEHLQSVADPDSFAGLAARVYVPVIEALVAGPAAAATFYRAPVASGQEEA